MSNNLTNFYNFSQENPGKLTIHFQDRLDVSNSAPLIKEFNILLRTHKPDNLVIDMDKLTYLDDYGVSVLVELKKTMCDRRGNFSLTNISEKVNEILSMHRFNMLGQQSISIHKTSPNFFTNLGNSTFTIGSEIRFMLTFLGDTCFSFLMFLRRPRSLRFNDTVENMKRVGLDALPIVGLISFLLGLIMAFMSSVQLQQFGANIYVASLVGISMTRELGPILTLFRADKDSPMGAKGVEIAYEIRQENGEITNWLIFQLEMEHLDREYGIDTKILSGIDFQKD